MDRDLTIPPLRHSFRCVTCELIVTDLNLFHDHLLKHVEGSGYYYDFTTKTGHIKFSSVSVGCQTELATVVDDATQTSIDSNESSLITCNATGENCVNEIDMMTIIKQETTGGEDGAYTQWNLANHKPGSTDIHCQSGSLDEINNIDMLHKNEVALSTTKIDVLDNNDISSAKIIYRNQPVRKKHNRNTGKGKKQNGSIKRDRKVNNYQYTIYKQSKESPQCLSAMKKASVSDDAAGSIKRKTRETDSSLCEVKSDPDSSTDTDWLPQVELDTKNKKSKKTLSYIKERRHARNKKLPFTPIKEDNDFGNSFKCHLCSIIYKTRKTLYKHIEKVHDGRYMYFCKSCLIPFVTEEMLESHGPNCKDSNIKSYACVECNNERLFISENHLKLHMKNNHDSRNPLKCEVCNVELMSLYHKRKHMVEHDPDTLKCSPCKYVAETVGRLDLHMTGHYRSMASYACIICGKAHGDFHDLVAHYYRHLDNEGDFTCERCGKSFACGDILVSHRTHCAKKFPCNLCDKLFSHQEYLDSHNLRFHTDKSLWPICDQCGISVTSKLALTRHVKMKHDKQELERYTCPHCQKEFLYKECYNRHLLVHRDVYLFSCSFCAKSFRTKWNKQAHERQHTGVKPYACSKCGMGFTHNVVKKTHEAKCDLNLMQS